MLELLIEMGENPKINQDLIKTASATVKAYLNGGIKNTLIPKFYYTSSARYAIDYKVQNKKGQRFYSHFLKKVEDHSFKIINYVKNTTRISAEDATIVKLLYRLAHHPLGSSKMGIGFELRKRDNSLPLFGELLGDVLTRLEESIDLLKEKPSIHESEVKKIMIILEQMTDVLQRAPSAFRGEGLVPRYLQSLMKVPEIQNK